MYWQDHYRTPSHAVRALKLVAAGKMRMTPQQAHIAHIAARSNLRGISEDPANLGNVPYRLTEDPGLGIGYDEDGLRGLDHAQLGSLKSMFKKVVKVANKLDPLYSVRKKIDPVTKFVDKAVGISSPKSVPKLLAAPATEVLPGAPPQPIPQLPEIAPTSPMSFSQGGGGGGGFSPNPAPVPGEVAPESAGLSMPVMLGIGAVVLGALYLFTKKRR